MFFEKTYEKLFAAQPDPISDDFSVNAMLLHLCGNCGVWGNYFLGVVDGAAIQRSHGAGSPAGVIAVVVDG